MINIRSNAMRGPYMRGIVDRTIKEIHDNMVTVFGPFAADAYLTMNGQPYYTRDGKETLRLMKFDNELSMYILKIMYQAVQQQGEKVGDGTTTLGVLYTNIYKELRENEDKPVKREVWNKTMKVITEHIKKMSVPMTKDDLIQMLFTCTQDDELSCKIYKNLADAIMANAYITINKSNIANDFQMTTHQSPVFKATKQFSILPIKAREERCTILHCNGILDIAHPETILDLMSRVEAYGEEPNIQYRPKTIVLLCNGVSEATRRSLKGVIARLNELKGASNASIEQVFATYNNVAIYTLDEYRKYNSEQLEDISTIITDEPGIGGVVNQLTFESMLYQAFGNPNNPIPELMTFDSDPHCLDKMRDMLSDSYPIEFDSVLGIRIHKPLGPVAIARYQALRNEIENEKSGVKLIELNKRLRTMYGQFIEVEVGSNMMKDSQRKYELILDAVLSASEGVEKGILKQNSLLAAHKAFYEYWNSEGVSDDEAFVCEIMMYAIQNTMYDMVSGGWDITPWDMAGFHKWYTSGDVQKFNLNVPEWKYIIPNEEASSAIEDISHLVVIDDEPYTFVEHIIEPVSIITTMLTNSTLIMELAQARTFQLDSFMDNYIGMEGDKT